MHSPVPKEKLQDYFVEQTLTIPNTPDNYSSFSGFPSPSSRKDSVSVGHLQK